MPDTMRAGAMLIKDGTHTPESVVVTTDQYSAGWSSITKSSSTRLGLELETAGWTFFYMAGQIRTTGFGLNDQSRTSRAMDRVIAVVKLRKCNCLEIVQVQRGSFLGLSYTRIIAHARHIQESRFFHQLATLPA
jgi:hypothetical protein